MGRPVSASNCLRNTARRRSASSLKRLISRLEGTPGGRDILPSSSTGQPEGGKGRPESKHDPFAGLKPA